MIFSSESDFRKLLWHLRQGGPLQVREWQRRRRASREVPSNLRFFTRGDNFFRIGRKVAFESLQLPRRFPRRSDVRVGAILDEFSAISFGYEWHQKLLSRGHWKDELTRDPIDLLFVESAWSGNGSEWQYQLTGSSGPDQDLKDLVDWCRRQGVPTVFWNKEDPAHYGDFLDCARLFDWVLTTDEACIPSYRHDLGHSNIATLTFAAQPAIHNPVRLNRKQGQRDVAFAGMYFRDKYPDRRSQIDVLLGGALDSGRRMKYGLEIFSRYLGNDDRYQFPEPYASRVRGRLSYPQMLNAYKSFKVFLNVNSVTNSPTMCARRVFEIPAAGAALVSTPSAALKKLFGAEGPALVDEREEAGHTIKALVQSPEFRERQVHPLQRRIWTQHTYAHRTESILRAAVPGLHRPVRIPSVSMCVSSNRPAQLDWVFETAGRQRNVDVELVLLTHGYEVPRESLERLKSNYGVVNVQYLHAPSTKTLGECLNDCFEAASGEVAAKIDDDDYYGSYYLLDQVNSLMYSDATLVGKQCHYMHFSSSGATMLRFPDRQHVFTNMVMGPTLVAGRDVFQSHPFPNISKGEDSEFLRNLTAQGASIYSADRYNYWQHRTGSGHTWAVNDSELLASGTIQFYGDPTFHVSV